MTTRWKMRERVLLVVTVLIVGCGSPIGDLNRAASRLVRADSATEFNSAAWRLGDRHVRGRMLAHFASTHAVLGRDYHEVLTLLGPSECYVDYEDEPCYWVQLNGRPYTLEFGVNHSDRPGFVVSVGLAEQMVAPRLPRT